MIPYLVSAPLNSLITIERLYKQLPSGRLDARIDPDRFTPREIAAHLADWEPILQHRIESMLSEDNPTLVVYDEGERAQQNRYWEQDVATSLRTFRAEREKSHQLISGLNREQMMRTGLHPERGPLTVMELVQMLSGHDLYHIEQLTEVLADDAIGTW